MPAADTVALRTTQPAEESTGFTRLLLIGINVYGQAIRLESVIPDADSLFLPTLMEEALRLFAETLHLSVEGPMERPVLQEP